MNLYAKTSLLVVFAALSGGLPLFGETSITNEVEAVLSTVDIKHPGLGIELRRLATESSSAQHLLETYFANGVARPEDYPSSPEKLAMLWKWQGFAAAAFIASGRDFDELLKKYPLITASSRLLGSIHSADGALFLLAALDDQPQFDGNHKFIPNFEIGSIEIIRSKSGEGVSIIETEAQFYEVKRQGNRDVLILKQTWRGSREIGKQQIRTQSYVVNNEGTYELIADKTDLVPWTPMADATPNVQPTPAPSTAQQISIPTVPPPSYANQPVPWFVWLAISGVALGGVLILLKRFK